MSYDTYKSIKQLLTKSPGPPSKALHGTRPCWGSTATLWTAPAATLCWSFEARLAALAGALQQPTCGRPCCCRNDWYGGRPPPPPVLALCRNLRVQLPTSKTGSGPARSPPRGLPFPGTATEILVKTLRRSHMSSVVHEFSPYLREETYTAVCPESCKWVALGWVSRQADARPQKRAFAWHTLNPQP